MTAALIAGFGARNCLEIGCFTGPVLSLLHERGIETTGVEISHLAFVLAYPSIKNRIRYGDLLTLDLQPPYDAVLAMDILEHFNPLKLDRYLERMRQLLARDGYCLINSPMFGHDEVFGDVDIPLPEWRAAGPETFWRHLHCDARGWPEHGHLVWASPSWWESRFAAHGLVRDKDSSAASMQAWPDSSPRTRRRGARSSCSSARTTREPRATWPIAWPANWPASSPRNPASPTLRRAGAPEKSVGRGLTRRDADRAALFSDPC